MRTAPLWGLRARAPYLHDGRASTILQAILFHSVWLRRSLVESGRTSRQAGEQMVYSGTPLLEALKAGGLVFDSGMAGLRDAVKMTVIVEAADGYQAAFSMAELDPELTDRVILLADNKDGQPLPPGEGPIRIIVPGEKRPARWVHQVKSLTVRKN